MGGQGSGQPTKLTAETRDRILLNLKSGCYLETAAAAAGIHRLTLFGWLRKGRAQTKGFYRDFVNAVEKAQSAVDLRDLAIIEKAAEKNWTAAAWRLERRHPKQWGRRVNIDGRVKGEFAVTHAKVRLTKGEETAARKRFYKMFPGLKPPPKPRKPRENGKK